MVMLANEIRIQLNQQAHEIQYTGSKENYCFYIDLCIQNTLQTDLMWNLSQADTKWQLRNLLLRSHMI